MQWKNPSLEARRKLQLQREHADRVLCARKIRKNDSVTEIEEAFQGRDAGALGRALLRRFRDHNLHKASRRDRDACRQLLLVVAERSDLLTEKGERWIAPVLRLATWWQSWIAQPQDWGPLSYNTRRQFASLARHLVAQYPVPAFMDDAWISPPLLRAREQQWFIDLGTGRNIRKSAGLPVALTKMMAHHFLTASDDYSIDQALRRGQVLGLGGSERLARAVIGSRLGQAFFDEQVEAFWATVLLFLVRHPMIDPHQVGPMIDYIHHHKFVPQGRVNQGNGVIVDLGPPQPGLVMKGRSPESLLRQVEQWHRRLGRVPCGTSVAWLSCGIEGFDRVEGADAGRQRRYLVLELLNGAELRAEGQAMRHCVATYAASCAAGRTAIYSLRADEGQGFNRRLTVELDPRRRLITQMRGRFNSASTPLDQRVVTAWATTASLTFSRFAVTREF